MSSRLTKKSLVSVPSFLVKTPCLDPPALAPSTRRPPTSTVISGAVSRSNCARSTSASSGAMNCAACCWCSCGSRRRAARAARSDSTSVCSCDASMRPGVNGTFTSTPAAFAAFSTAAQPPRTIRSASETFLPLGRVVERLLDRFELLQHLRQLGRIVDLPILLRAQANARAIGAAALVGAAERRGRRPCGRDQLRHRQAGREDLRLQRRDVLVVDQRLRSTAGIGSCQISVSFGTSGPR